MGMSLGQGGRSSPRTLLGAGCVPSRWVRRASVLGFSARLLREDYPLQRAPRPVVRLAGLDVAGLLGDALGLPGAVWLGRRLGLGHGIATLSLVLDVSSETPR